MKYVFDIETDGLLFDCTMAHCIVLKDIDKNEILTPTIDQGLELLSNAELIIGHNIIFDMNFLKVYLSDYESIFKNRMICDTFYLSKIYYYYHTSFSLASLCHKLNILNGF